MTRIAPSPIETLPLKVFQEQQGRLWGFFLRGTAAPDIAGDLLQEAFLRIWDRRRTLETGQEGHDPEDMRKELWRIARNLMVDEIRLRQRRRVFEENSPDEGTAHSRRGTDDELEWREGLQVVGDTVGRVKNRQGRRCLRMWFDGMRPEGIAFRTRLGPGQVRALIRQARSEVIIKAVNRFRARRRSRE